MAKPVHSGLFIGSGADSYKFAGSILHCARDPWYTNAPSDSLQIAPNVRLMHYNEMALNMVDADHPKYFSDHMVDCGLNFISDRLAEGDACLVHCNEGVSRGPSMGLLWLFEHGFLSDDFRKALVEFRLLYPRYMPNTGIFEYLKVRCKSA